MSAKLSVLLGFVTLGFILATSGRLASDEKIEHPFIEPADIKSETCLGCHAEKNQGKFVHTAVLSGCESCHTASSEEGKTTMTLVATGGDLCLMCHEIKEQPVMHGPYKQAQCLTCHDSHNSGFPAVARAEPNTLCMSCHGTNQPEVRINREARLVTVLGNQTLTFEEYAGAGKLRLDRTGTRGHPILGHPIVGRDPRNRRAEMNCLSCHLSHGSDEEKLLQKSASEIGLCGDCHQ
jgi:predicted CXXCH cytochrome family protein